MGANLSSGGGRGRHRRRGFSEINVTPFVDVMLVLLIIFMVTAPMLTTGVKIDLPQSKAGPLDGKDEQLSLNIKRDGTVMLQDSPITIESLSVKLANIVGEKPDTRVVVRADKDVDYGFVMRVVGEVSAAGFTKIALESSQISTGAPARKRR